MGLDRPPLSVTERSGDPVDALSVLGDETRVSILRALADADAPLAFSELRRRADVSDTGRFNYHLGKLCEYFVRETPEGYELGHAGSRIVDLTGDASATDPGAKTDPGIETACPVCGEADCDRVIHVHLRTPW
jgi:hypothetical protein